jgi:Mrp family chromosome partitioning ATPase/NifU-like protein involved in Fe-S cluster formation
MSTDHIPASNAQSSSTAGMAAAHNHIQHVIAVMSGKGGVGKSFVTGLLACSLAREGYAVGILDADITGPSIPLIFGVKGPVDAGEFGIIPIKSRLGIKIMSMNLLLTQEDQPVIWRGPLVSRGIKQLWDDVLWGELDYLLIDLPPGTSDATLTIMQSLPVKGLIMVTTPQSLSSMVVRKAVHMAQIVGVEIIGIIENMSYFQCPETGKTHRIFGASHTDQIAMIAKAPIIAEVPIHPQISQYCDDGKIEMVEFDGLTKLVHRFLNIVPIDEERTPLLQEIQALDKGELPEIKSREEEHPHDLSDYSPVAQRIIVSRENMGSFNHPDLRGKVRGCCGDSMQIDMMLENNLIKDACYTTDGCFATMACGGMLTKMIKGKTLQQAAEFEADTLLSALGGLPKSHMHCANLAVKTLRTAIDNKGFVDEYHPSRKPENKSAI